MGALARAHPKKLHLRTETAVSSAILESPEDEPMLVETCSIHSSVMQKKFERLQLLKVACETDNNKQE
jgi:hypothetical protein